MIPVFIAASAFGLDWIVQTDFEKISILIGRGIKGVEEEDAGAIEAIVSADYKDSFHYSREQLRRHCERELSQSLIEKSSKLFMQLEISPPTAIADLTVMLTFEKDSYVARNYKQSLIIRVKLHLQKGQNGEWLINRIELLAIDNRPVNWRQIR